jgi:hypothetical protein
METQVETPIKNPAVKKEEVDQNENTKYTIKYTIDREKNVIKRLEIRVTKTTEEYTEKHIYKFTAPPGRSLRMAVYRVFNRDKFYNMSIELSEDWLKGKAWFFNIAELEDKLNAKGVKKTVMQILRSVSVWSRTALNNVVDDIEDIM